MDLERSMRKWNREKGRKEAREEDKNIYKGEKKKSLLILYKFSISKIHHKSFKPIKTSFHSNLFIILYIRLYILFPARFLA